MEDPIPTLMFLVGIALAIIILMRRSNRYFRRRRKKKDPGPLVQLERPETPDSRSAVIHSEDLARQEVHLHDRARALMAQLDSKIRVLQQLMIQTEQQIERMESLLEQAESKTRTERQGSENEG